MAPSTRRLYLPTGMRIITRVIRGLLWLIRVCVLLGVPVASAASPSLIADFDGDGKHDRVELDHCEPSALRIWLSSTRSTSVVRSPTPILIIAARDLDGDRRDELIATGGSTPLRVWTTRHKAFTPFRAKRATAATLSASTGHSVEHAPTQTPAADAPLLPAPLAPALTAQPCAPALIGACGSTHGAACLKPSRFLAPLASRPPPPSL